MLSEKQLNMFCTDTTQQNQDKPFQHRKLEYLSKGNLNDVMGKYENNLHFLLMSYQKGN